MTINVDKSQQVHTLKKDFYFIKYPASVNDVQL